MATQNWKHKFFIILCPTGRAGRSKENNIWRHYVWQCPQPNCHWSILLSSQRLQKQCKAWIPSQFFIFYSIESETCFADDFFSHCLKMLKTGTSAVAISDVSYTGIIGTASGDEVMSLNCGTESSCNNIVLDDVHLKTSDPTKTAFVHCVNFNGRASNVEPSLDQCLNSWATIDLELHRRKELFYFRAQFAHDIYCMSHVVNLML